MELSPEIRKELDSLPKNYNIIPEADNIDYLASRRLEVTKIWIPKLLKLSLYFNMLTLIFIGLSILFLLNKPEPKYYGTTPNGKVILLKTVKLHQTKQGLMVETK